MRTVEMQYRGVKYTCELPTLYAIETDELLKYRGSLYSGKKPLVCVVNQIRDKLVYRGISWQNAA
jgi:hypothetical protein